MIEKWKHLLDNGHNIGVPFKDLSKALDVLNHSLLLPKLHGHGLKIFFKLFFKICDFYSKLLK